jgi:hypothetical protein
MPTIGCVALSGDILKILGWLIRRKTGLPMGTRSSIIRWPKVDLHQQLAWWMSRKDNLEIFQGESR